MDEPHTSRAGTFLSDCERIHREWQVRAKALDTEGLLALYAADAVLESPLVTAILNGRAAESCAVMMNCVCSSRKVHGAGQTNLSAGTEPAPGSPMESGC